jgi:hypothetical protein
MLSKFFCRFKGVAIIHLYDEEGKKIDEFAKPDFCNRFSWPLFVFIVALGLVVIGQG